MLVSKKGLSNVALRTLSALVAGAAFVLLISCEEPVTKQDRFGAQTIPDQNYVAGVAIPHLTLPSASGSDDKLTYDLLPVPPGLRFDRRTRILSGVPAKTGSYSLTYSVSDRDGDSDERPFRIKAEPLTAAYWVGSDGVQAKLTDGATDKQDVLTTTPPIYLVALDSKSPQPGLYYSDGFTIRRTHLDGSGAKDIVTAEFRVVAITIDPTGKLIWFDASRFGVEDEITVWRANPDGSSQKQIMTISGTSFWLPADSANGHLYWAETVFPDDGSPTSKIRRANLDGTSQFDVINVASSVTLSLVLDYVNQKLYWSEFSYVNGKDHEDGVDGRIRRANLDGSGVQDIVIVETYVFGIDVDSAGGMVYWSESDDPTLMTTSGAIRRANLDGSAKETVIAAVDAPPFTLRVDPDRGKLYWSSSLLSSLDHAEEVGIGRANLDGTATEYVVERRYRAISSEAMSADVLSGRLYWTAPTGTCHDSGVIIETDLAGGGDREVLSYASDIRNLEFDVVERKLYWIENAVLEVSDGEGGITCESSESVIRRASLDGSADQELVGGLGHSSEIELDAAERKLYWTERVDSPYAIHIRRSDLDGSSRETVVEDLDYFPQGIAIDSVGSRLYWEQGNKIYGADLNDPIPELVMSAESAGFYSLHLHAVDGAAGKLYYTTDESDDDHGVTHTIWQANLDGGGARIVASKIGYVGQLVLGVAPPAQSNSSRASHRHIIMRQAPFSR